MKSTLRLLYSYNLSKNRITKVSSFSWTKGYYISRTITVGSLTWQNHLRISK